MDAEQPLPVAASTAKYGSRIGQCKWWSNRLNYGFITVSSEEDRGADIFCHHSGVTPLNSKYRTLRKGEYCNFDVVDGAKGKQAVAVTGIAGGPLMCDVTPYTPRMAPPPQMFAPPPPPPPFGYGYGQPYFGAPPPPPADFRFPRRDVRASWTQQRPQPTVADAAAWPTVM